MSVVSTHTPSQPQFPQQDLFMIEGKVQNMDSLTLTPLPSADSSGEVCLPWHAQTKVVI